MAEGQTVNEWGTNKRMETADRGWQTAEWTVDGRPWTVVGRLFSLLRENTLRVFVTLWFIFI
jgi:hypothetical protein